MTVLEPPSPSERGETDRGTSVAFYSLPHAEAYRREMFLVHVFGWQFSVLSSFPDSTLSGACPHPSCFPELFLHLPSGNAITHPWAE